MKIYFFYIKLKKYINFWFNPLNTIVLSTYPITWSQKLGLFETVTHSKTISDKNFTILTWALLRLIFIKQTHTKKDRHFPLVFKSPKEIIIWGQWLEKIDTRRPSIQWVEQGATDAQIICYRLCNSAYKHAVESGHFKIKMNVTKIGF